MFTGLVERLGAIETVQQTANGRRLRVDTVDWGPSLTLGDSVAINGCCLTAVDLAGNVAAFDAGPETLSKTNLGELVPGDAVNLERALQAGARLGGHVVQGHVDGTGRLASRSRDGEWETIWFEVGDLTNEMVPKGSVAVDGVSLTVVDVAADAFSVALIPHTLQVTTLGRKEVGATVNIETDVLGKYVLKYLGRLTEGLSLETLKRAGFAP